MPSHNPTRYNKGPRANRGGLADGWASVTGGNILKVWGTRTNIQSFPTVQMPRSYRGLNAGLWLRGWVKIVTGSGVRFGTDYGSDITWSSNTTNSAPDGWYRIDQFIGSRYVALQHPLVSLSHTPSLVLCLFCFP